MKSCRHREQDGKYGRGEIHRSLNEKLREWGREKNDTRGRKEKKNNEGEKRRGGKKTRDATERGRVSHG